MTSISRIIDGSVILVDSGDQDLLSDAPWKVRPAKQEGVLHVVANIRVGGKQRTRLLHREIAARIAASSGKKYRYAWTKNGNGCDLRRENMVLSQYQPRAHSCPWSQEELLQLYLGQLISVEQLCSLAADRIDADRNTPITEAAVHRWLADAGITRRTPAEESALRSQRDPDAFAAMQQKGRSALAELRRTGQYVPDASPLHTPEVREKLRATIASAAYRAKHRAAMSSPELRARLSERRRAYMASLTPEERERIVSRMLTERARKRQRATMRKMRHCGKCGSWFMPSYEVLSKLREARKKGQRRLCFCSYACSSEFFAQTKSAAARRWWERLRSDSEAYAAYRESWRESRNETARRKMFGDMQHILERGKEQVIE